ncbi:MAG: hypothetical protein KC912_04860 [Proteobacteria bacterium]|nr:hypothetical protein [Pseudomonadota bacterium]
MWRTLSILALWSCAGTGELEEPTSERAWNGGLEDLEVLGEVRGFRFARSIIHLHSPWSHDACDGEPLPDGSPDLDCLEDLRYALCTNRIEAAFLTDHPTHAAFQPYEDLFHAQPGDTFLPSASAPIANAFDCDNGHRVHWMPGIEDELMPIGLDAHVPGDAAQRDQTYNDGSATGLQAAVDAGGAVLINHTEGRESADLLALQDAGLTGVEIFNLHAMFAPDIRQDDLGLEALGWVEATRPFIHPDETGEPDLMFIGLLMEQAPSIEHWDTLLARGPMTGVGGTDAHRNAIPLETRDGERFDSYRRSLRWFSNHLLVEGEGPEIYEEAVRAGRVHLVFEALGLPVGVELSLEAGGETYEIGSDAPEGGTLTVGCPSLSADSPQGPRAPEITVNVYKDGELFHEGCGEVATDGDGVYRARVDVTPFHLEPFLGATPEVYFEPYPWAYTNAIRVGL